MIRIVDGNAFCLRITGQIKVGDYTEAVSLANITSPMVYFTRRGREVQDYVLDNGKLLVSNSGNLAIGVYSVEIIGYYQGQSWRHMQKNAFEIVDSSSDATEPDFHGAGDVDGYDTTRYSTLSILARCVGFHDWDDFLANHARSGESSNPVLGRALHPDDIPQEGLVRIAWAPDRRVLLRHLGDGHFLVMESENSKLKPGDSFHCSYLILGEPLYLDNFVRGSNAPTLFVVGNKGGLTEARMVRE